MADETTTPIAAPSAAPTPATPAPVPVKTAEEKLHERVAAVREKEKAAATEPKTLAPVEAKVDMDPETLKKLTEASEKARAAEKRAAAEETKRKEIEAGQADVAVMRDAMKLWKSGDRVAAIAKLSAVDDPSADIEDLLQKWVAMPEKPGERKLTAGEIKALEDEVAEGKKFRESEQARQKAETDAKNAHTFSVQQRDAKTEAGEARYPLASSPENAETSAVVALEKANEKLLELGVTEVTRKLAEHLFALAYAEIEANLAKEAAAKPATTIAEAVRPAVRAAVVPRAGTTPAAAKNYPRTPEGARQRLMDRAKELVESKGERWS